MCETIHEIVKQDDGSEIDFTICYLPMPQIPDEAWKFLEQAAKESEVITGSH